MRGELDKPAQNPGRRDTVSASNEVVPITILSIGIVRASDDSCNNAGSLHEECRRFSGMRDRGHRPVSDNSQAATRPRADGDQEGEDDP